MAIKEKKRKIEEEKEKEVIEIKSDEQEIIKEMEELSREVEITKPVEIVEEKPKYKFPEWIEYPWMYIKPKNPDLYNSWLQSWGNLLLKWASFYIKHVISLNGLLSTPPYSKLTTENLREIMNYLVKTGFAKWLDENRLRIYWKSLEELADYLYDWALNTGTIHFTPYDLLQESPEIIKNLPTEDLLQIISILVSKKKAKWMDKNKRAVKILLPEPEK